MENKPIEVGQLRKYVYGADKMAHSYYLVVGVKRKTATIRWLKTEAHILSQTESYHFDDILDDELIAG